MSNVVQLFAPPPAQEPRWTLEQSAQLFADAHAIIDEGMPQIVADATAPTELHMRIRDYFVAWRELQAAPEGKAALRAEDNEGDALFDVLATIPKTADEVAELIAFLDWYVAEEADRVGSCPLQDVPFAFHRALKLAVELGSR